MRLIDADALMKTLIHHSYHVTDYWNSTGAGMFLFGIEQAINEQPTIDAVPKEKILLFLNTANKELLKAHADKSVTGIMAWNASVTTLKELQKEYDTEDTDIVPVIRCKDCKNYSGDGMYCGWNMIARADGFCFHANEKPVYEDD